MIELRDVSFRFERPVLQGVRFVAPAGAYTVLTGRSGAGKTTLLELIAGLRAPDAGAVWLDGRDVTRLPPAARGVGYVPQDAALFRSRSVAGNLAFGLAARRTPRAEVAARVADVAAALGLTPLLGRSTRGLSGGERQRVALGRALAIEPRVLLLDEPFGALDPETRAQMHGLMRDVRTRFGPTILHVSHHEEDAAQLADAVVRLEGGALYPTRP